MRVLATGGGTGGHVYPALVVLRALTARHAEADIAWVGRPDSVESRIIAQEGLSYHSVSCAPFRGAGPLGVLRGLPAIARGVIAARALIARQRPDVVFATGGYVSVPLVLAAWTMRRPVLLYLPDMEPGLAVRMLAPFARRIAVSFDTVLGHFSARKAFLSGYPVRVALYETTPEAARAALGLEAQAPVVLVFGGSTGAHSMNEAVAAHVEALLGMTQLVHISGLQDHAAMCRVREALPAELAARYHLYDYLHTEMTDALAAADLVVARAGAATLGEFPAVGLPAVLVPYPYSGQHQHPNAEYLASRGGAVVVEDRDLAKRLVPVITELLGDDARRGAMRQAMRAMARPGAADSIVDELTALAGERVS